jgi:hypothetical protein
MKASWLKNQSALVVSQSTNNLAQEPIGILASVIQSKGRAYPKKIKNSG